MNSFNIKRLIFNIQELTGTLYNEFYAQKMFSYKDFSEEEIQKIQEVLTTIKDYIKELEGEL